MEERVIGISWFFLHKKAFKQVNGSASNSQLPQESPFNFSEPQILCLLSEEVKSSNLCFFLSSKILQHFKMAIIYAYMYMLPPPPSLRCHISLLTWLNRLQIQMFMFLLLLIDLNKTLKKVNLIFILTIAYLWFLILSWNTELVT